MTIYGLSQTTGVERTLVVEQTAAARRRRLRRRTAAAAAAAAPFFAGPGLVDGQGASVGLLPVQGRHRGPGLVVVAHLHEAEAFRPARLAVRDDLGRLHVPVCR